MGQVGQAEPQVGSQPGKGGCGQGRSRQGEQSRWAARQRRSLRCSLEVPGQGPSTLDMARPTSGGQRSWI